MSRTIGHGAPAVQDGEEWVEVLTPEEIARRDRDELAAAGWNVLEGLIYAVGIGSWVLVAHQFGLLG